MTSARSPSRFTLFSRAAARGTGHPLTFFVAVAVVVAWLVSGPLFHFSDTWQLVINTATTIITFLMVFLIQNTQNRDTEALQLKLDELIRAVEGAENQLIDLEEMDEAELERVRERYARLAQRAREGLERRGVTGARDTRRGTGKETAAAPPRERNERSS